MYASGLWVAFTLFASAAQTLRNAMQRELIGALGAIGAAQVRFLFGLPFAVLFLFGVRLWTGSAGVGEVRFRVYRQPLYCKGEGVVMLSGRIKHCKYVGAQGQLHPVSHRGVLRAGLQRPPFPARPGAD